MTLIRNLAWGLLVAGWVAGLISFIPIAFTVLSSQVRADIAEMGGLMRLLLAYAAAAFASGVILGILRPIARHRWGPFVIGGSVTTVAASMFLTVTMGLPFLGSWSESLVMVPLMFAAGAVATPMWRQDTWMPDWDRMLAGLQNTAVLPSSQNDEDKATKRD